LGKSHLLKNITTDKNIEMDDTDNIKIISANSAFPFQGKRNRFGDALEDFTN
jgi:hypothetical protein